MKKQKILIVEDELIVAYDLATALTRMGYEVLPLASTADEAYDLAMNHNPDIVFMDVKLKGPKDGLEAVGRICQDRDLPVIFLTGQKQFIDEKRLKDLSRYSIISKPIDNVDLRDEINKLIPRESETSETMPE